MYRPIPQSVSDELIALRTTLDAALPAKWLDHNLLVATWNLRAFGGLTESWAATDKDSPKRDLHALACIAEIVSRFDVIAIQEVRGDLKALRHLLKLLGRDWGFVLTDVTKGSQGNDERLAFVFDKRRVGLSGLACELVLPKGDAIVDGAERRQFARTPYAVSFLSGDTTFILVTLHVVYGKDPKDRVGELEAIARWLRDWANDVHAYHHNLVCLGDFNIDRNGDPLYQAFTSTGLTTPAELDQVARTIFDKPGQPETANHYDQIAWFKDPKQGPVLSMQHLKAGTFDFLPHVLQGLGLDRQAVSWRISDHRPLWVEFGLERRLPR